MKSLILQSLSIILALAAIGGAQTRLIETTPEERAAKIEAVREARRQQIKAERAASRQRAREAGVHEARQSRTRDRQFLAVWSRLTPEVRVMYAARDLAERLSRQPAWDTQTRAGRISAVTQFISNYPAIKTASQQADMDAALGAAAGAYHDPPATEALVRVLSASLDETPVLRKAGDPVELATAVQPPSIAAFPVAEVPDLFSINRRFHWEKPNGQWMNQMLKDIDGAKANGDGESYEALTKRYSAWADKYLRSAAPPDLDGNPGR